MPSDLVKGLLLHTCLPSHVFISSHPLLCALPFHHFSHLISRSPSLYRSLSESLASGIYRHSEDGTRAQDTSQHHRHVRLWDPCCSCWGPRSCCLHQHQGWPGQMVGNLAWKWMSGKCMFSIGGRSLIVTFNRTPLRWSSSHLWNSPLRITCRSSKHVLWLQWVAQTIFSKIRSWFAFTHTFGWNPDARHVKKWRLLRLRMLSIVTVFVPFRYTGSSLWELGAGGDPVESEWFRR